VPFPLAPECLPSSLDSWNFSDASPRVNLGHKIVNVERLQRHSSPLFDPPLLLDRFRSLTFPGILPGSLFSVFPPWPIEQFPIPFSFITEANFQVCKGLPSPAQSCSSFCLVHFGVSSPADAKYHGRVLFLLPRHNRQIFVL